MNNNIYKRERLEPSRPFPVVPCQYGENCYRRNPDHFAVFSHQHLNDIIFKILKNGKKNNDNQSSSTQQPGQSNNSDNAPIIPDHLVLSRDIIFEQIKVIRHLFPQHLIEMYDLAKKQKLLECQEEASTSTATSSTNDAIPSSTSMVDSKVNNTTVTDDNASTSTAASSINAVQPSSSTTSVANTVDDEKVSDVTLTDAIASTSTAVPLTNTVVEVNDGTVSNISDRIGDPSKRNIHDYISVVIPKGNMAKKLKAAAPYNFFLTTITSSPTTHNEPLSVTLQEILDESLGVIETSLQINFMIDIGWLLGHYYFANIINKPLLILYGDDTPELNSISAKSPNVKAIKIQMPPFATHHAKMMLLGYVDGSMRVIISTANLYEDDWHNRTQGIWISPKLEKLQDSDREEFGESPTEFRIDLIRYLMAYNLSSLQPWIARIRKTNFSDVNVFLVASVPGSHHDNGGKGYNFGHAKVGNLLAKHCPPIDDKCPMVAQSSSIGTLGLNVDTWVINDIGTSFRKDKNCNECRGLPTFKMIYPSFENVKGSHDDLLGGGCLPYTKKVHDKQPWLMNHLHQWKCGKRARSQAMPHIKTYCRWSKDLQLHWFMLTSANLSKAAWGSFNKNNKILPKLLRVNNYEVGVLFLPTFVINNDYFPMEAEQLQNVPIFPMPYDIPLTRFGADDVPFFMDLLY